MPRDGFRLKGGWRSQSPDNGRLASDAGLPDAFLMRWLRENLNRLIVEEGETPAQKRAASSDSPSATSVPSDTRHLKNVKQPELGDLRDAWRACTQAGAALQEALLSAVGTSKDDELLLRGSAYVIALNDWAERREAVPEEDAAAIYAESENEDVIGGLPQDLEGLEAAVEDALRLTWQYKRFASLAEQALERSAAATDPQNDSAVLSIVAEEAKTLAGGLLIHFEVVLQTVDLAAWSARTKPQGAYGVRVVSTPNTLDDPWLSRLPQVLVAYFGRLGWQEAEEFLKRVSYVGPQRLFSGATLDEAIRAKESFEALGGLTVKIDETSPVIAGGSVLAIGDPRSRPSRSLEKR